MNFIGAYVSLGGVGATLALALVMFFFAKSQRYKTLGRLTVPTTLFNINEPIIYGTPIVLNPLICIPFIGIPIINTSIAYLLTLGGILPRLTGYSLPWTTPPVINGFLWGGWSVALVQVVLLAIDIILYYMVFKILDKKAVIDESQAQRSEANGLVTE
jgi:PTS system cellobiose-specific IIC component